MKESNDASRWAKEALESAGFAREVHGLDEWWVQRCYLNAQPAIELAMKAVMIHSGVKHPYTHDLNQLWEALPSPPALASDASPDETAAMLSYSSILRTNAYFADLPELDEMSTEHATKYVHLAETFAEWADAVCGMAPPVPKPTRPSWGLS